MIDIQKLIDGIHGYLAEQITPLVKRLEVVETAKPKDGQDGAPGKDGVSVDAQSVAAMVQEAVASIPVPQNGTDGTSVPIEEVERMVAQAVTKAVGALTLPKDGEPGRDATHLEILPAIAEGKAYPRGTYAKHAGGLWRAYEATEGMRGWECIVEGVKTLEVTQDGRGFTMSATLSSGATQSKSVRLPAMIYRGVFKEGEAYEHGDTVTWGGSLWHCDEDTAAKPGELGSNGWRLAAKRGRDGKDGLNGKDMTKGVAL